MSPRHSASDAARTREAIVEAAVRRASVQGLEGMSIGQLAADVGMSKAGVVNPFGTKHELQFAAFARGIEIFRTAVWQPVAGLPPGRQRLLAIGQQWFLYLIDCPLPGGCFVTSLSVEWDSRPGPLRDALAAAQRRWLRTLAGDVEAAVSAGELPAELDPAATAFQINAIALGLNQAVQLLEDAGAKTHAERALERLLAPAPARCA